MRILLCTGLFPNRTNLQRGVYVLRQAVALSRRVDVRVIAPVPYFPAFAKSRKYSGFSRIPRKDTIEGIDVVYPRYYVIPRLFRFHHGLLLVFSVLNSFRRMVGEFRPDVVIGFFAYPYGYATVQLARMARVPVIVGVLGSDINVMARSGLRRRMVRGCLNASDKVFSVSRALKQATIDIGVRPEKIIVIPNGVDAERFARETRSQARAALKLPDSGRIVLCVANLVRIKGVDLVVRAFRDCGDESAVLVVVGDGEEREELQRLIGGMGLEERIRLVGAKPPTEVPRWLAASDLVVLGSRAEGHPNVLLEALASGRPVVATRVGGVSETITKEELGLLVEPEDAGALATGIREALSREWDEDAIRQIGVGRTWDNVADEIIAEVQSLLASGSVRESQKRGGDVNGANYC